MLVKTQVATYILDFEGRWLYKPINQEQTFPPFATLAFPAMTARGVESPMDFQWQTHAPADATSPFHRLAMDHNGKKRIPSRSYTKTISLTWYRTA